MRKEIILSFSLVKKWIVSTIFFGIYSVLLAVSVIGKAAFNIVYLTVKYFFLGIQRFVHILTSDTAKKIYVKGFDTGKGIAVYIASLLIGFIKRIPFFIWYIIKQTFYLLEKIFLSIIHFFVSLYKFILSIYFRYFMYGFIFCLIVIFSYQSYLFVNALPSPQSIGKVNFAQSTHLYDRNGKLLYEIYRDVNRTSVPLESVPENVINATIAIEDKNFYNHKGISFFGGVLRAVKDTVKTNELQGGSTITQQLVKSALLTPERTIERKLKEMALALWSEQIYTKDQIMEMYLNQVPYGGSAYGIEEAAQVYFGKSTEELSLGEAALLAGLPKAPSIYSPFINPDLAVRRRNQVLEQMEVQGFISRNELLTAENEKLAVLPPTTNIRAPHFVMYARTQLENEYGSKQIEESGFNVITTIDLEIQEQVEQILQEELVKLRDMNVSNGGIVVLKPDTGEILAMVGSSDYFKDTYGAYNVTTALRQPGSTLKPLLYAMALERGFTAATPIDDSPIIFQIPGGEPYQPKNYDLSYHGRVPIRYALANSYNVPAVKVLNMLGVQSFVDFARNAGIDTWQDSSRFGLSLSLGGGEVTLLDLTQIYSVLANGGYRVEPTPVRKITDHNERLVEELRESKIRVVDEGVSFIISDILSDNTARLPAFGPNNSLHIPGHTIAAKTGTTNDYKDAWTVGFTPEVVVGVWVGNNNNEPMYNVPGSMGAAPIFNRVMTYLVEEKGMSSEREKPQSVVARPCYGGRDEYFLRGTEDGYCQNGVIRRPDRQARQEAANINRP